MSFVANLRVDFKLRKRVRVRRQQWSLLHWCEGLPVSRVFSSRRRRTRCSRDWSSDVCSSDLVLVPEGVELLPRPPRAGAATETGREHAWQTERLPTRVHLAWQPHRPEVTVAAVADVTLREHRSGERRGGEEGRSRGAPDH